ncbi:MAG: SH3 domain-containing protein [Bacteroidota bacterium]
MTKLKLPILALAACLTGCGGSKYPDPVENLESLTATVGAFEDYTLEDDRESGVMLVTDYSSITADVMRQGQDTLRIFWEKYDQDEGFVYTALYTQKEGNWVPLFVDEYIAGKIIIQSDLDGDGNDEFVVDNRVENSSGGAGKHELYRKNGEGQYVKQQTFTEWKYNMMMMCCNSMELTVRDVEGDRYLEVKEYSSSMEDGTGMLLESTVYTPMKYEGSNGLVAYENAYLLVAGNDIWVRSEPTTGNVVMRLNDGTAAKILEVGKEETINGRTDVWYRIQNDGNDGWIFGAQTSKAQPLNFDLESEEGLRNLLMAVDENFEEWEEGTCSYTRRMVSQDFYVVVQECERDDTEDIKLNFYSVSYDYTLLGRTTFDDMAYETILCDGGDEYMTYCLMSDQSFYAEPYRYYEYEYDGETEISNDWDPLYIQLDDEGNWTWEWESELSI